MKSSNPSIPTRDTENDAVIFVSIELSKKSWLAAIHTPLADKIALHKVCIAPGSLDTSLSHAAGLSDIAVCHA